MHRPVYVLSGGVDLISRLAWKEPLAGAGVGVHALVLMVSRMKGGERQMLPGFRYNAVY